MMDDSEIIDEDIDADAVASVDVVIAAVEWDDDGWLLSHDNDTDSIVSL